jgi:hypothetical protein
MKKQTMRTEKLLAELKARGMRLEPHPVAVTLDYKVGTLTPDIVREIAAHKEELRAWLNAEHLAKQVLSSEFIGGDIETTANLVCALKASGHPLARRALVHLLHAA